MERIDGHLRLAGKYTRADGERLLATGKAHELLDLRAAIVGAKNHVESQLDEYYAKGDTDPEWAARSRGAIRAYQTWLTRIAAKLGEYTTEKRRTAIVLRGAAGTAEDAAEALNLLLERGCHVMAFSVVGPHLVVIATDPKPT